MKKVYDLLIGAFLISGNLFSSGMFTGHTNNKHETFLSARGMHFTPNKGQIVDMDGSLRPDVLYKSSTGGSDVYLRKTGISYVRSNMSEVMHEINEQLEENEKASMSQGGGKTNNGETEKLKESLIQKATIKVQRLDVDFAGGNPDPETITADQADGYTNYYYAHCPNGITHVNSFNEVLAKNIYDKIDVKYYSGKEHGFKYDIVVNPGADADQIKLKYSGYESIQLKDEKLHIETALGKMEECIPKVYQLINGKIVDVKARYKLISPSINFRTIRSVTNSETFITFELGPYDHEQPLIIDPFIWATYCGGSGGDYSDGIAVDAAGNSMITGQTSSVNFPTGATAGNTVFQAAPGSAFVIKFSPAGARLWATYCSGAYGHGIATDAMGNVAISGYAFGSFPSGASAGNNVFQGTPAAGGVDAFVLKLDLAGFRLWATYYGGGGASGYSDDKGESIAIDLSGNIVITGYTQSTTFPIGSAAGYSVFQSIHGPGSTNTSSADDAFVVKFDPFGNRLWASYYGGSGSDNGGAIATDLAGNIVITGATVSPDFPIGATLPNTVFQSTWGGNVDAMVVKFSPTGVRLWATYYGGSQGENYLNNGELPRCGIAVDLSGNVIISGYTASADLPIGATPGNNVFQSTLGFGNGFLVKFSAIGDRLWATHHGGNTLTFSDRCAVDNNENIYVLGEFEDSGPGNFPMNTCALQKTYGGGPNSSTNEDWYVTKFSPTGKRICSTFLGGSGEDELEGGAGIACFQNYVFVTGSTSGSLPVTAGAFQTIYGGSPSNWTVGDAVVAKFCGNSCGDVNSITTSIKSSVSSCSNSDLPLSPSVTSTLSCDTNSYLYKWYFPGALPSSSTNRFPVIRYSAPGTYTVSLVVDGACVRDSISKVITITNCGCTLSSLSSSVNNLICYGSGNGNAQVTISTGAGGPYSYSWNNGSNGTTSATIIPAGNLTAGSYTVTITEGSCKSITAVTITQPKSIVVGFSTQWSCPPNKASLTASASIGTSPYSYSWNNGQSAQTATGLAPGNYTLTVKDQNSCTTTQTITLILPQAIATSIISTINNGCNSVGSARVRVSGTPITVSGSSWFSYILSNGATGTLLFGGTWYEANPSPLASGSYTITVTDGLGCTSAQTFNITGTNPVSADFTSPATACAGSLVNFTNTGTTSGGTTHSWGTSANYSAVSGTTTDFSYTFLTPGTYSVTHIVTNAGCQTTVTKNITINNCSGPSVTATSGSVCSGSCATISSIGTGGTSPYTYSWSNGGTTQNINPCPISTTTYTVTIKDTGGNTSTSMAVVTVNPAISATTTSTNITCSGSTNGSAITNPVGGTPGYIYSWSNGGTTSQISNLSSQIYTVTITDSKGCSTTSTATIISPQVLTGQFAKGTVNCVTCGCKEWLMVNATGGTSPYSYSWPDGFVNRYKNQLCPGSYTVNVKDNNGCSVNISISAP